MKVIICGSISAADEILSAKEKLERADWSVEIPEGVKHFDQWGGVGGANSAQRKIEHDLIRGYYEKIKLHDAVLVVNPEKKGIKGYIGGNTLIEMAFAHVLGKPLYVLYPLPELPYTAEILAMQPVMINGDLSQIKEGGGIGL